ncbi:hypothetical protein ACWEPV_34400, partial [Streptomyces cacaoi]
MTCPAPELPLLPRHSATPGRPRHRGGPSPSGSARTPAPATRTDVRGARHPRPRARRTARHAGTRGTWGTWALGTTAAGTTDGFSDTANLAAALNDTAEIALIALPMTL